MGRGASSSSIAWLALATFFTPGLGLSFLLWPCCCCFVRELNSVHEKIGVQLLRVESMILVSILQVLFMEAQHLHLERDTHRICAF